MPRGRGVQTYLKNSIAQEVEAVDVFAPTWTDAVDPHFENSWQPLLFPFNAAAKVEIGHTLTDYSCTSTRNS